MVPSLFNLDETLTLTNFMKKSENFHKRFQKITGGEGEKITGRVEVFHGTSLRDSKKYLQNLWCKFWHRITLYSVKSEKTLIK